MPAVQTIKRSDVKQLSLDDGIYREAKKAGLSVTEYLSVLEQQEEYTPTGMVAELDAFQRQLIAHEITQSRSLVDDFFKTKESAILFPEYINRQVTIGMNLGRKSLRLSDLYSMSEKITSGAVKQTGVDFDKEDTKAKKVVEGSKFPKAKIDAKETAIALQKVGREIDFSYESIRRLNVLSLGIILQRMGWNLSRQMTQEGLKVIVNGDGNTGSAAGTSETVASATWKYADLIDLIFKAADGHEFSHVVLPSALLQTILTDATNFPQFQSMNLLEEFVKTGEVRDFLGVAWRTHDAVTENSMVAYEKDTCLTYYEEAGSNLVETDRWIDRQIQGTVVSVNFGFGKMFNASAHHKTQKA